MEASIADAPAAPLMIAAAKVSVHSVSRTNDVARLLSPVSRLYVNVDIAFSLRLDVIFRSVIG